jgi:hypothetical protein
MAVKKTTKAATTASKSKKVTAHKSGPTHEEIRKKAEEIYYDRIARGADGTSEDDWHLAEKLLKAAKK